VNVQVIDGGDGRSDLILGSVRCSSFTEHDLRDIEFTLAQRRAMSRRCPEISGGHTCGNAPDHRGNHLCRACTETWSAA